MTCSNIVGVDVDSHRVADLWITGVYPVNNFPAVDKCKNWELSTGYSQVADSPQTLVIHMLSTAKCRGKNAELSTGYPRPIHKQAIHSDYYCIHKYYPADNMMRLTG